MIDPTKITEYNCSDNRLEELILFWVCAAGKNGVTAARCLNDLLTSFVRRSSPFEIVRYINDNFSLSEEMKRCGIGCYNNKSITFKHLISSNLDLKTCSVQDLESIHGIGPKTARCFLIHSRENQMFAGLDRHALKFLKDKGHDVPKATPTGKKYLELEKIFLDYVKESGKTVSDFDLSIWLEYRGNLQGK